LIWGGKSDCHRGGKGDVGGKTQWRSLREEPSHAENREMTRDIEVGAGERRESKGGKAWDPREQNEFGKGGELDPNWRTVNATGKSFCVSEKSRRGISKEQLRG